MRFFAHLAYFGKEYHGWQVQENTTNTVQEIIQEAIFTISRIKTSIVGCGRTDTGVHALAYYIHFDSDFNWEGKEYKINSVLPPDIVFYKIIRVTASDHARFDAISRSYIYKIHTFKNPFKNNYSWYYRNGELNIDLLNTFAAMLINYKEFYPFCKSNSGVEHYQCDLSYAVWEKHATNAYTFSITSNRFLRGMVRLIVGAGILLNENKLTLSQVESALEEQRRMIRNLSAPPEGLYLDKILYPPHIQSKIE